MDSERSRSAAVLCRSRWKRDAKEPDVWSRTGFASRERERPRALRDAVALVHVAAEGRKRIPWVPRADGLRMVPECGSPLPLWLGTGRERTRRLVPHGVRESRARADSRTPGRWRAHPRPGETDWGLIDSGNRFRQHHSARLPVGRPSQTLGVGNGQFGRRTSVAWRLTARVWFPTTRRACLP